MWKKEKYTGHSDLVCVSGGDNSNNTQDSDLVNAFRLKYRDNCNNKKGHSDLVYISGCDVV